jgi:hypothetical protein
MWMPLIQQFKPPSVKYITVVRRKFVIFGRNTTPQFLYMNSAYFESMSEAILSPLSKFVAFRATAVIKFNCVPWPPLSESSRLNN